MVMSSVRLGTKNHCAGEGQQQFSSQVGLLRIDIWGNELSGTPTVIKWGHEHRSWGIYFVEIRYQATTSENKLRRFSVYCSEKSSAWISESVIITGSYDL
jgi:hypothetical protein